jgi:tetratricopeptide (TPR) repeat protein
VLFYLGELVTSRDHFEAGISLCDSSHSQRLTMPDGRDLAVSCRAQMARVLWLLGYPDQALMLSVAAHALARELAHPLAQAFALFVEMLVRQFRREVVQAQSCADSLMVLAREHGLAQYAAWAEVVHGWASTLQGSAQGIARIRESLDKQDQMRSVLSRPHFLALLADAMDGQGQVQAGLIAVSEGLTSVKRFEERYYEAELLRLKGELLQKSGGEANEAADCFAEAIEVAARQGARSLELRAVMSLARRLRQEGKRAEARTMLASVYGWFTEGVDTQDMLDAKALLDN